MESPASRTPRQVQTKIHLQILLRIGFSLRRHEGRGQSLPPRTDPAVSMVWGRGALPRMHHSRGTGNL